MMIKIRYLLFKFYDCIIEYLFILRIGFIEYYFDSKFLVGVMLVDDLVSI